MNFSRINLALTLIILRISFIMADPTLENLIEYEQLQYYPEQLSILEEIKRNPLNVNSASALELKKLPWLDDTKISIIITARTSKPLINRNSLIEIGLNRDTIKEIIPYIRFQKQKNYAISSRYRLEYNTKDAATFNSLKCYQKLLYEYKAFRLGFVTQKDCGEADYLDFYSYFLEYQGENFIDKVILGKYRLRFGRGLLFASQTGIAKTANIATFNRDPALMKGYSSSFESWDLEGAVIKFKTPYFQLIPFFSRTGLDASLEDDRISSFREDGIHIDDSNKNNLIETISGLRLIMPLSDLKISLTSILQNYSREFAEPVFRKDQFLSGLDFSLDKNDYIINGEICYYEKKTAGIIGFTWKQDIFTNLFMFRYYPDKFPNWHGKPYYSSVKTNEIGFHYGLNIKVNPGIKIKTYFDTWKNPRVKYWEKMPTSGTEEFLQIELGRKKSKLNLVMGHTKKQKYINIIDSKIRDIDSFTGKFTYSHSIHKFVLKSGLYFKQEYILPEKKYQKGLLFYQYLKIDLNDLILTGQVSCYHSDVLIYSRLPGLNGTILNRQFSGDGFVYVINLKYKFLSHFEVQMAVLGNSNKEKGNYLGIQLKMDF